MNINCVPVEEYSGYWIMKDLVRNTFYVEEHSAMAYVSIDVAKRCIDTLVQAQERRKFKLTLEN